MKGAAGKQLTQFFVFPPEHLQRSTSAPPAPAHYTAKSGPAVAAMAATAGLSLRVAPMPVLAESETLPAVERRGRDLAGTAMAKERLHVRYGVDAAPPTDRPAAAAAAAAAEEEEEEGRWPLPRPLPLMRKCGGKKKEKKPL